MSKTNYTLVFLNKIMYSYKEDKTVDLILSFPFILASRQWNTSLTTGIDSDCQWAGSVMGQLAESEWESEVYRTPCFLSHVKKGFEFCFCFLTPFLISRNVIFGNEKESWQILECFTAFNVCLYFPFIDNSFEPVSTVLCVLCIHLVIKRQSRICIKTLLIGGRSKSSLISIPTGKVLKSKMYLSIIFIFKRSPITITTRITWILFILLFKRYKRSHMIL